MRKSGRRLWPWILLAVVGAVVWKSRSWLATAGASFFAADLQTKDELSSVYNLFVSLAGLFVAIVGLAVTIINWWSSRKGSPADPVPGPPPGQVTTPGMISLDVPRAGAERTRGRDALIRKLVRTCQYGAGRSLRVHVLHGMGGVGKTTIALHVARQVRRQGVMVWWIPVTDKKDALWERLQLLAEAVGATRHELDHDWAKRAPDVLWSRLNSLSKRWLLVLDNADDVDLLTAAEDTVADARGWIRPPATRRGMLLITSRHGDPRAWGDRCRLHRVGMLSDVDGAHLLNDLTGPDAGTREQAERLAARLGGLPLALTLAGHHLADAGRHQLPGAISTYTAYLHALDRGSLTAVFPTPHADVPLSDAQARAVITHTWELSLTQLRNRGLKAATILLRLLSLFAAAPVPYRLLLDPATIAASPLFPDISPPEANTVQIGACLDGLATLSLITLDNGGTDATPLHLHPLIREASRTRLVTEHLPALYQLAACLLGHASGRTGTPSDPTAWPAWQLLSPHPLTVLIDIGTHTRTDPEAIRQAADAALRVTAYLSAIGHYHAARAQAETILTICEPILGGEHHTILEARGCLALYTGQAGNSAAARKQFTDLLPMLERIQGVDHPDTLMTRHHLAEWTGMAGDSAAARDQLHRLLSIREQVLGIKHPDTLTTRHHLAKWIGAAGDPAPARDELHDLLPIREQVLGIKHPDTLTTRHHLAEWIGYAGDETTAHDQLSALLPIREQVLGPEHPDTLTTRHHLALWTKDASGQRDLLAELLPIRERVLGVNHPDTLMTRYNLAHPTGRKKEEAADARDRFAALLTITERVHGPEHPQTLATRISFAYWTGAAGDPAAARDQLDKLLPIVERMHGREHPSTLIVRNNLAANTGEAGDPGAARDQFSGLLSIHTKQLGADHPDTLTTRDQLAWWTGEAGDAVAAREQYARLLSIRARLLGDKHPDTRATRHNLEHWRRRSGVYDYSFYPEGQ